MYKSKKVILFLVLEIIAIFIHFSEKIMDTIIYNSYVEEFIGYIYLNKYHINYYININKEIFLLNQENALLINKIIEIKNKNTANKNIINNYHNINFIYINAKILTQNKYKNNNFIILNKGLLDGIENYMGVISPQYGIIGIITSCTTHFSKVTPIPNTKIKISVKIKNSACSGILYRNTIIYNEQNIQLLTLPQYVKVQIGEYIETDGKSNIFPEGLKIGKIINYKRLKDKYLYIIKIKLYNTPSYLINNVYIVKSYYNQEFTSLTFK